MAGGYHIAEHNKPLRVFSPYPTCHLPMPHVKTSGFLEKDGSQAGKQPQFVPTSTGSRWPGAQRNDNSFWLGQTRVHTNLEKQPQATAPSLDKKDSPKAGTHKKATEPSFHQLLLRAFCKSGIPTLICSPLVLTSSRDNRKWLRFLGRRNLISICNGYKTVVWAMECF